jgi:hypothetical protein
MRAGTFTIQTHYIDDEPELVLRVMEGCIVIKAQKIPGKDEIAYVALAEHFEEVPLDELVPEYDIDISDEGQVQWTKKETA